MGEHVLFRAGIRLLGTKRSGFIYRYPDTGETVRQERVLRRIENLKVPPAWEAARIARSPSAKAQAISYDSAARVQYPLPPQVPGAQGTREVRADYALCRHTPEEPGAELSSNAKL
jgi:DNA topoisomerase IB